MKPRVLETIVSITLIAFGVAGIAWWLWGAGQFVWRMIG